MDTHFAHELLFLKAKLLFSILDSHSHFIFANYDLSDALVTLACHSIRRKLLLVYFPPLDDLAKPRAHIVKLEVSTRLGARVLIVRIIIEIYAFVVDQVCFIFSI